MEEPIECPRCAGPCEKTDAGPGIQVWACWFCGWAEGERVHDDEA